MTGSPTMSSRVELITPAIAAKYMAKNVVNRPLSAAKVRRYAGAIRRGEWRLSHEGIAFSEDGRLLDGQHRLSAIMATNIPVSMLVVRGLPADSFHVIGQGWSRQAGHVLSIDGHKNSSLLAAIASVEASVSVVKNLGEITPPLIRGIVDTYGDMGMIAAAEKSASVAKNLRGVLNISIYGWCRWRAVLYDQFVGESFFDALGNMEGVRGDPVYALRMRLLRRDVRGRTALLMMVCSAWKAHVRGRRAMQIKPHPSATIRTLPGPGMEPWDLNLDGDDE